MTDTKEKNEWDNREMGALWLNVKQGTAEKYLTGHINNEKVKDQEVKNKNLIMQD